MNHYWVHNFNSTSSLLGGAVVAGDARNTAIYYNPALIGEMETGNNLSLAANLFSWNFYIFKNALGNGINLNTDNFQVQPQFFSYSYKPTDKGLNISFSVLTRIIEKFEMNYNNSTYYDVLGQFPGPEKYNTSLLFRNDYNDTWVGLGISHDVNDRFSYGMSLFCSISSLNYQFGYSALAINSGDSLDGLQYSRVAEGSYNEIVKFTDYRLIAKFGLSYKINNWWFGLTLKTPTWRLFSSGKRVQRVDQQININREGYPAGLSDYVIFDGQEKNQLSTNFKIPFSTSFGFVHNFKNKGQKLYFSAEYFMALKQYKLVNAKLNPDITIPKVYDTLTNKDWSSFYQAANDVLNVAIGYSLIISDKIRFLNAIRTDFGLTNRVKYENAYQKNYLQTTNFNIYHYSSGVGFSIKRNKFIAGGDVAFGFRKNLVQIVNFSDPEEYNTESGRALQGTPNNNMDVLYIGFSIYIAATLNFEKEKSNTKK